MIYKNGDPSKFSKNINRKEDVFAEDSFSIPVLNVDSHPGGKNSLSFRHYCTKKQYCSLSAGYKAALDEYIGCVTLCANDDGVLRSFKNIFRLNKAIKKLKKFEKAEGYKITQASNEIEK